jgi:hypothetical protein
MMLRKGFLSTTVLLSLFFILSAGSASAETGAYIWQLSATSELPDPDRPGHYEVENIFDGSPYTSWVEGDEDAGKGESVTIAFVEPVYISKLVVSPGFFNETYWRRNNRVRTLKIVSQGADGKTRETDAVFRDVMLKQDVPLNLEAIQVQLVIGDVYDGTEWNDTCIAEVEVHGPGGRYPLTSRDLPGRIELPEFSRIEFSYRGGPHANPSTIRYVLLSNGTYERRIGTGPDGRTVHGTWTFSKEKSTLEMKADDETVSFLLVSGNDIYVTPQQDALDFRVIPLDIREFTGSDKFR